MKPEQLLWQLVRPHVPGHVDRVENAVGVGMPDVHTTYRKRSIWIELKVAKWTGQPVIELMEPSQRVWHVKCTNHGGVVLVLVREGDALHIYQAILWKATECAYLCRWSGLKPWDWYQFSSIFSGAL